MTDAREIIARACTPTPDECWHGAGSLGPSTGNFTCHVYMWQRELPRADAVLSALHAAGYRILGPEDATVDYEVWTVGDEPEFCASSTSIPDAEHYALVYGQDSPVEIIEVTRRAIGRKA